MSFDIAKFYPAILIILTVAAVGYYIYSNVFARRSTRARGMDHAGIPEMPPNNFRRIDVVESLTVEALLKQSEKCTPKDKPMSSLSNEDLNAVYSAAIWSGPWISKEDTDYKGKTALIYEPVEEIRRPVKIRPFSKMKGGYVSQRQPCNIHQTRWSEYRTFLGREGIYHYTTKAELQNTLVLLQISDFVAEYLHAYRLAAQAPDTIHFEPFFGRFPVISFDPDSGAYYYCIRNSRTVREDRGVALIWPLINMSRDVFEAFAAASRVADTQAENFTVYNALGYTHLELETPTMLLVYSDKTAWFNAEQETMNQPTGIATQLLEELEEKITEPGWITVKPNHEKVIRWYVNPVLNKE